MKNRPEGKRSRGRRKKRWHDHLLLTDLRSIKEEEEEDEFIVLIKLQY